MTLTLPSLPKSAFALTEPRRVMRKGAPFVVSFSNRCFPSKAVAVWRSLDAGGHAVVVTYYLKQAGFHDASVEVLANARNSDPLTIVVGRA